jgi:hypothetical protein
VTPAIYLIDTSARSERADQVLQMLTEAGTHRSAGPVELVTDV